MPEGIDAVLGSSPAKPPLKSCWWQGFKRREEGKEESALVSACSAYHKTARAKKFNACFAVLVLKNFEGSNNKSSFF